MRGIGGVIAGLIVGVVAMMAVAFLGGLVFPIDAKVNPYDAEQVTAAFGGASLGSRMMVILSWFAAALAGAAVAKKISGEGWAAWTVAGIITLYVLASILVLPMPAWMKALAVAAPLIGGFLGSRVSSSRRVVADEDETPADAEI